jgi:chorismate mutase / prephenate dehydrogenase
LDEVARIRARIDAIDQDILQLLKSRYENAKILGQIKRRKGLATRDRQRERKILAKIQSASEKLDLNPQYSSQIFRKIFTLSLEAQRERRKLSFHRLRNKELLIIGGTGAMGQFFSRFITANGGTVTIAGRNQRLTVKTAQELGVKPGTLLDASNSDVVIVAVPMKSTREVCIQAANRMHSGALLIDLCSVKSGIADVVAVQTPSSIEYVSLHPLFGPDVDHLDGQNIATVSYRTGPQWDRLSRVLTSSGARIIKMTSDYHDRTMALVQVAHHYALLSLADSLKGWSGDLKTNSIKRTIATVRSLLRNWDTIIGIQQLNPYARQTRIEFAKMTRSMIELRGPQVIRMRRELSSLVQKWSRKP